MKKALLNYPLVLFTSAQLYACRPAAEPHPSDTFPNRVGYQWTYTVTDSASAEVETVQVAIVGKARLSNAREVMVWQYTYPHAVDSQYVYVSEDTVRIYNQLDVRNAYGSPAYVLPLKEGQSWGNSTDQSRVLRQENLTVAAGSFAQALRVRREATVQQALVEEDTWIAPQVGMVKLRRSVFSFAPSQVKHWELVRYKVAI